MQFNYTSMASSGDRMTGTVEARDKNEAIRAIEKRGQVPISITPLSVRIAHEPGTGIPQKSCPPAFRANAWTIVVIVVVAVASVAIAISHAHRSSSQNGRSSSSQGIVATLAAAVVPASPGDRSVMVTTLAGRKDAPFKLRDGVGSDAVFGAEIISGIAVDPSGNVYVYDGGYFRKITPDGVVTTLGGTARKWFTDDASKWACGIVGFEKLAVDGAGNLYVQDWRINRRPSNRVIWVLMPTGETNPLLRGDLALWGDGNSNIYVGDTGKGTYWRFTATGLERIVSCNTGVPGTFAVDNRNSVYVSQQGWQPAIRKISPAGDISILAGGVRSAQEPRNKRNYAFSVDGVGTNAEFSYPGGIAVDAEGNVLSLIHI